MLYEIISSTLLLRYTQVQIASPELCLKHCTYVVPSDSNTMLESRKKSKRILRFIMVLYSQFLAGHGDVEDYEVNSRKRRIFV